MKAPLVILEFSGEPPAGDIVDGSQEILDALDDAKLEADDETRLMTADELIAQYK